MSAQEKMQTDQGHLAEQAALKERLWLESQENIVVKAWLAGQSAAEVLPALSGFKEAFNHQLDTLDCSDGRVCLGHKMGLAGEGVLLNDEERELLRQAIKKRGLKVTGHDNCGAAYLAHPGPDSDAYGYDQAKKLADETGAEYCEVHYEDFRSPVHDERCLVLDASGRFDCANWSEFPAQFISSAPALGLPDSYTKKEVTALTNIALGDHGFGQRFNAEQPFYVLVSADNSAQLARLMELARSAVADFGDRVKVDGFVVPTPNRQD